MLNVEIIRKIGNESDVAKPSKKKSSIIRTQQWVREIVAINCCNSCDKKEPEDGEKQCGAET